MSPQEVQLNLQDIQGNILTDYRVDHATYLFYRVDLAALARRWLAALIPEVTTEEKQQRKRPEAMLNVAMTFHGLKALGVSPTSLDSFPIEFREGMKKRAALLCDFGESAPERWDEPLGDPQVHMLIVVHGLDRKRCDEMAEWVKEQASDGVNRSVTLLCEIEANGRKDRKEHFGFRDGISQPWIAGTNPGPPIEPDGGKRTAKGMAPLSPGEFILGYKDELGRLPAMPKPVELGMNGTYLVLRKLRQDVAGFWNSMEEHARKVLGSEGTSERLAALMLGRWPSGCPVSLSPEKDDLGIAADDSKVNAFNYDADPNGRACPVGAHIRRLNPRDLKLDNKGNVVIEPLSTRHRMIRRGLPYGESLNGRKDDERDRGLLFIALVADIARQFEFVQRNWINSGDPLRLDRTDRDPLAGNNRDERDVPPQRHPGLPHPETPRKFGVPASPRLPWALNLPEFVTTRGGDYFFLPSLTALRRLAGTESASVPREFEGSDTELSSFLSEYEGVQEKIQDPAKQADAHNKLISSWLIYRAKEMFDELRKKAPIFQTPGYPAAFVPPITIVTKYEDVLEALDGARHPEFSVKLYRDKMEIAPPRAPRGPFILGMEAQEERYKQELAILGRAVQNSPVSRMIPQILEQILDPIFARIGPTGRLDVIQDLAWPVPLGLNDKYFGIPGPDDTDPDDPYADRKKTFKRWLRDIYKELFLNLRKNPEWTSAADIAASEMNPYLDGLIQQIGTMPETPGCVLKELVRESENLPPGTAPNFVRRNMMGLTVGVVETCLKAIARTIDQLIRRPQQLKEAQEFAMRGERDKVLAYALEAMRFNPQNHVLFRVCTEDTIIAEGTPRQALIKRGTLVFAATLSAMFDEDGPFKQAADFRPSRKPESYLFFGYGPHECLGRHLAPIVLREILMRLLRLKNLRRANDDPFDPIDLLPEHFLLEFDPEEWAGPV